MFAAALVVCPTAELPSPCRQAGQLQKSEVFDTLKEVFGSIHIREAYLALTSTAHQRSDGRALGSSCQVVSSGSSSAGGEAMRSGETAGAATTDSRGGGGGGGGGGSGGSNGSNGSNGKAAKAAKAARAPASPEAKEKKKPKYSESSAATSSAAASAAQRAGLRINFDDLYRKLLEDPTLQLDQAVVARMSTAMQSYQVRLATDPVAPPPTLPRQPARAATLRRGTSKRASSSSSSRRCSA